MSVTYTMSGRSAKGGQIKQMVILSAAVKVDDSVPNSAKTDLEVIIECPEDTQPKVSIMGGERGNFHIGFTPSAAGQYWIDLIFKGVLANEPFLLPIKDSGNKVPAQPNYTGKLVNRDGASGGGGKKVDSGKSSSREAEDKARRDKEEAERRRFEEQERLRKEEEEKMREEEERMRRDQEDDPDKLENEEDDRSVKEEEERLEKEKQEKTEKRSG